MLPSPTEQLEGGRPHAACIRSDPVKEELEAKLVFSVSTAFSGALAMAKTPRLS